jgi:hypothetical protein
VILGNAFFIVATLFAVAPPPPVGCFPTPSCDNLASLRDAMLPAASTDLPRPAQGEPVSVPTIRIATPGDAAGLADWLQAAWPLPPLAARARQAMLDRLLARPELGACLVAEAGGQPRACLPALLVPHLGLHGLVAQVGEWWAEGGDPGEPAAPHHGGAYFAACLAGLYGWCAAHGIRHLLLAPDLPVRHDGLVRHPSGLWHIEIAPAPKSLG